MIIITLNNFNMRNITLVFLVFCSYLFTQNNLFAQCCNFSYQQQVEPVTSAATFGVALGDFDNDGDSDVVAISAYYGIDVYFNNGSGTFTLNAQYATGGNSDFYGVHVADVDNDGDQDIIAIPFYNTSNLTILKNNGLGVFTVSSFASNIGSYNAAIGDIDGDGDVDVFLPAGWGGGNFGKVLKNDGTGTYSLFQTLTGAKGEDAALGDLDGDGDLDAFVTENSTLGNTVFLNNGTGTFTQLGATFGSAGGTVALGDLDGDGDLDAWVGTASNISEIWINDGSGVFTLGLSLATHPTWGYCKAINLYDNDGDGDLDVFLGFYSFEPQVWTNNGNLSFSLCYQATVGSSSHGQAIGDVNNDGKMDIYSGYFSNDDGDYVFLNAGSITAGIIYKNSPFCYNNSTPQSVEQSGSTGGTYSASPSGLTINSTNGEIIPSTSTIGTYTVTYSVGGCAFTTSVQIIAMPGTAGTITGPDTLCSGQTGVIYSVPLITDAISYTWQLPFGATISSGSGTDSITVNYSQAATSGVISVTGHNSCGDGTVSTLSVLINPQPSTPTITLNGYILHSNALNGNQWYNQNGPINLATNQDYTVTASGNYYVIVTLLGCSSDTSNIIHVVISGIEQNKNNKTIEVYPNPVSDELTIEKEGNIAIINFEIFNAIGKCVFKGNMLEKTIIPTNSFSPGIYLIKLETLTDGQAGNKTYEFKTVVKE